MFIRSELDAALAGTTQTHNHQPAPTMKPVRAPAPTPIVYRRRDTSATPSHTRSRTAAQLNVYVVSMRPADDDYEAQDRH
jgi:hypothetical protein